MRQYKKELGDFWWDMSTSQLEKFQDEVVIPEGITVTQKKHMLTFVGPLGKTHKSFRLNSSRS